MKKAIFAVVAMVMAGVITSCAVFSAAYGWPVKVVYKEIPYSELAGAVQKMVSAGHGFIVEAYFVKLTEGGSVTLSGTPNGTPSESIRLHDGGYNDRDFAYVTPRQFEIYDSQTYKRIDPSKKYKIHLGFYYNSDGRGWAFIDKIEGLRTTEEAAAIDARQKAEEAAKKKAEADARAAAQEAKFNPDKLNRAAYKETTVEDFSFDMVAGNLAAGTKVAFKARFMIKPTGTSYRFENINGLITLSTKHNFVRDIPNNCFDPYQGLFGWQKQDSVTIYVTVKNAGQMGECSVDIVEWKDAATIVEDFIRIMNPSP